MESMITELREMQFVNNYISIILPTYKPGEYIKDCLASIQRQTLHEFEVLVILNGPRDPYEEYVQTIINELELSQKTSLLYSEKAGVSHARNLGIEKSRGEYICFIDDDDVISSNYLESLLEISNVSCIGCSNSYSFKGTILNRQENFLSRHYRSCASLPYSQFAYRGFLSPIFAKLFHRNIIGNTRFNTHLALSEDSLFCMEVAPRVLDMKLGKESCCYYLCNRTGSVTSQHIHRPLKHHVSQMALIEYNYLKTWLRHPFGYNLLFVATRCLGCLRNFVLYMSGKSPNHW